MFMNACAKNRPMRARCWMLRYPQFFASAAPLAPVYSSPLPIFDIPNVVTYSLLSVGR